MCPISQIGIHTESLPVPPQVKVSLGSSHYSWQPCVLICHLFHCHYSSFGNQAGRNNPIYYWKQTLQTSKCCTLVPLSVLFVRFPAILWQNGSVFLQSQSVLYTGVHKSPLQIAGTALHAKQEVRSRPWMGGAPARSHCRHSLQLLFQLCWWTNTNRWRFDIVVF